MFAASHPLSGGCQTGGRRIRPTLCQGDLWEDLWEGNVQIDGNTEQPIMFDSWVSYGHNESQYAVERY